MAACASLNGKFRRFETLTVSVCYNGLSHTFRDFNEASPIMRTSPFRPALLSLSLCTVLLAFAGAASAQAPNQAPPKMDKLDDSDTPITVTTKPGSDKKIVEKRENGRVTEATVTSGPSTYTVKANNINSTAQPGDALGSGNRGPQWTVMEFDIGKKKKKQRDGEAEDDSTTPPPAAPQR